MGKEYDTYVVKVRRVPGVARSRMLGYIYEAVRNWGGQFEPQGRMCEDCLGTGKSANGKQVCRACGGDAYYDGDPLGPPCPLMKRGALVVKALPRKAHGK